MDLWVANPLNLLAASFAFANFVVNSVVALVIWGRIYQHRLSEISQHEDKLNDRMFLLAGIGFTLLAVMYLSIALGRAGDISTEMWALSRIAADIGTLCVAAYGAYRMTVDRYRFTIPLFLLVLSTVLAGFFVWLHT
jgi:hypothetical protein